MEKLEKFVNDAKVEYFNKDYDLEQYKDKISELNSNNKELHDDNHILNKKLDELHENIRCKRNHITCLEKTIVSLRTDLQFKNSVLEASRNRMNDLNLNLVQ